MDKYKETINRVGDILREPVPRDGAIPYIEHLELVRFDLAKSRVDAMQFLYEKRKQMLWPKDADKSLTELDRNTRLNGDVAILERDYQFLQRLEKLLDDRIELAANLID